MKISPIIEAKALSEILEDANVMIFDVSNGKSALTNYEAEHIIGAILEQWLLPIALISEVENASNNPNYLIVDVRDKERFDGLTEPIDLIAGHIPGAKNIPFTENIDESGLFLKPQQLKSKYEQAFGKMRTDQIIVHCGSGVTACHTLLALDYAGIAIPNLYVGSWSEWSRNDKKIETAAG